MLKSKNVNDEVSKDSPSVKTRKNIGMPDRRPIRSSDLIQVHQHQHVWLEREERSTYIR